MTTPPNVGWRARLESVLFAMGAMELALSIGLADALSMPAIWLRVAAIAVGAVGATRRLRSVISAAAFLAAALLLLVSLTPLINAPVRALVQRDAPQVGVTAMVVYSGGMTAGGLINGEALTRLLSAAELAAEVDVRELLLSSQSRGDDDGGTVSSEADQRRLLAHSAPLLAVHVVAGVSNTHNESMAFAAFARQRGWGTVYAVTSPIHSRRACASLRATGLAVICLPSSEREFRAEALHSPVARLEATRAAVHELFGLLVYKLRGWL